MPIFEYKCNKCDAVDDKLVSRADADANVEFECDHCNKPDAKLQRTHGTNAAALRFKGRWYTTTRGY